MRKLVGRVMFGLIVLALMGSCTTAQKAETPKADTAAITAAVDSINKAFTAAIAARDTESVVSFYADDAEVLPPGSPRASGKDGIRAAWVGFLRIPDLSLTPQSVKVLNSDAGDLVVDVGSYTMKAKGPKGPIEDVGKYVTVYRKTDAGWRIVVDTFNSDKAPSGH